MKIIVLLACALLGAHAQIWPTSQLDAIVNDRSLDADDAFNMYLDAFGKSYEDHVEYEAHKTAFLESLQYIRDTNAAESPFKVGLTPMADVFELDNIDDDDSDEDVESTGTRKLFSSNNLKGMLRKKFTAKQLNDMHINNTVDWRPLAPPVLQQHANGSKCGACWSFAATGAVSIVYAQATGKIQQLSQQQIVSCDTESRGCGGGGARRAMEYIYANGGVANEETYPYKARTGKCNQQLADEVAVNIKGYCKVPKDNETAMALALSKGPLTVSLYCGGPAFPAWKNYKGGILDPSSVCNETNDYCDHKATHVVVVVGMTEVDNVPVWIIRNSWGRSWGDNGYAYIPRNKGTAGMFGLATAPSLPVV